MTRPHPYLRRLVPALFAATLAACGTPGAPGAAVVTALGGLQDAPAGAVTIEAVVGADLRDGLGGFFVESAAGAADADPATAEGLWVRWSDTGPALPHGSRVRVHGELRRAADGVAELAATHVDLLGTGSPPAPVVLTAPPADWAALAGMRVRVDAPLTVGGTYGLARDGGIVAAFGGRLPVPTEVAAPGAAAARVAADNARRRVLLDDDRGEATPNPALLPLPAVGAPLRTGSVLRGIEAVYDPRAGGRLRLLQAPAAVEQAPRPGVPAVAGPLRIAALNVLNLFNGDGHGGGFPTPRGAADAEAYARQQAKLVAVLAAMDADLVALMEIENDGSGADTALARFAAAVAAATGHDWRALDAGAGPGTDAIRVAQIYRADRVRPQGAPATLGGGPFADRSRMPLAQAWRALDADGRAQGEAFVLAVNHFKSKGCGRAAGAEADQGDGQGCWNPTRVDSARRVDAWLRSDPTGSGGARTLLVGDLNAYAQEDPLRVLREAGWRDAFADDAGAAEFDYSFVYDGQAGRLDHALASPALAPRLRGAAHWHVNADEAGAFAYEGCAATSCAGPWAASDHDPLLIGLDPAGPAPARIGR
ncbi:ExeM/NucH family extracellular endonuclease [Coralloluteibacterium stylophorae]|uniref:ExeM/NucH family extracellular endonuclease n=1 Tax=Coralloluteibacterium stylophorae TaxID=1776034 RepID=A0A8J7VSE2_9GAMM|nr:ExeM/NucH family extracellular endonuclease [Coralloluteibacterium stylophorae]MBS7458097.1 ExeM/NucH family extracellular endonuclease [Coralloluteibacterium stylophorae]